MTEEDNTYEMRKGQGMKGGQFTFLTSRPVTEEEGKMLETVITNWARCFGVKVGSYWYEIKDYKKEAK